MRDVPVESDGNNNQNLGNGEATLDSSENMETPTSNYENNNSKLERDETPAELSKNSEARDSQDKHNEKDVSDVGMSQETPEKCEASGDGEKSQVEKNREDGRNREKDVEKELQDSYPESEGYSIQSEMYLRDADGNRVKDPETGETRRIDFVVIKIDFVVIEDGKVVDMIEVTSMTAPKDAQIAKEERIRDAGGNYVQCRETGKLFEIPRDLETKIERRP